MIAVPNQIVSGATTMPAQNQATMETQKMNTVTGNSSIDQPPTARKPLPGMNSPRPAACQAGDRWSIIGSTAIRQSSA